MCPFFGGVTKWFCCIVLTLSRGLRTLRYSSDPTSSDVALDLFFLERGRERERERERERGREGGREGERERERERERGREREREMDSETSRNSHIHLVSENLFYTSSYRYRTGLIQMEWWPK